MVQGATALHVNVGSSSKASISTQIAALRRLLLGKGQGELADRFADVVKVCVVLYV